jgi:hypothetical protein
VKNIKFYGVNLEEMDDKKITKIFEIIKEELQWHKFSYGQYPERIHAYYGGHEGLAYLSMVAGPEPNKNTMVISVA